MEVFLFVIEKRFHAQRKVQKRTYANKKKNRQPFSALKKHLRRRKTLIYLFAFFCFSLHTYIIKEPPQVSDKVVFIQLSEDITDFEVY